MSDPHDRLERRRDEPDPAAVGFVLQLGRALLLLVPGSVRFRSLTSLMERKALAGIERPPSA